MAAVQVTIVAAANPPGHRHAVLRCGGKRVVLPITSPATDHAGMAGDWRQVPRPNDRPLIGMAGLQLQTTKLTCTVADTSGGSVEPMLRQISDFARDPDHHVAVANYGSFAAGPWHITDLAISSDRRRFGTNHITRAMVTLTLTEAVPDPNPRATKKKHGDSGGKRPKTYRVHAGDTLPKIAVRFYGHADRWHDIAKTNHIRNPRHLKVGEKLRLP